jgi:hypothetical protein
MIRLTKSRGRPPLGGFHTPWSDDDSLAAMMSWTENCCALVVVLTEFGIPGGVSRDGGSIVLMERIRPRSFLSLRVFGNPIEMAMTDSATAISSLLGSNNMLSPTATTSIDMVGLAERSFADLDG